MPSGPYVGGEQFVDEAVAKGHTLLVDVAGALGQDARSGDGETLAAQTELLHEGNILGHTVVMIAGDLAGMAAPDGAGLAAEHVPDGKTATIFVGRALDGHCLDRQSLSTTTPAG